MYVSCNCGLNVSHILEVCKTSGQQHPITPSVFVVNVSVENQEDCRVSNVVFRYS